MHPDLASLLPDDKIETEKAEAIVALGFPVVAPILPRLVEWMQDINWPVAQTLQPFLASIGAPLAPHVRHVLATNDEIWKYWIVRCIVGESVELAQVLKPELQRLASLPTPGEVEEEVDQMAREILARVN
jgi:hypothetical protein